MSPDMSTRTLLPKPRKAAPKLRTINLREQFAKPDPVFFAPMDVDEETGVIKQLETMDEDLADVSKDVIATRREEYEARPEAAKHE